MHGPWTRPTAIVIGSDELGSAVAVALDRAGYATILCDRVDPPWLRRGVTFTDAWYAGNAEFDGATAVFCASVKSIPAVLQRPRMIAATTWSWAGGAASLPVAVVIDARLRPAGEDVDLRARAPTGRLTVGIGPGYVGGRNADIAIATAREGPGTVVAPQSAAGRGEPLAITGAGGARFVHAPKAGRFVTGRRIGDRVAAGERVGAVGETPVCAPLAGALRGLSARGARVAEGEKIVEIDPRGDPALCFRPDEGLLAIARAVIASLALWHRPSGDEAPAPVASLCTVR